MKTSTITRRSRCLGLSLRSRPFGTGAPAWRSPNIAEQTGLTPKGALAAWDKHASANRDKDVSTHLFIGRRQVISMWHMKLGYLVDGRVDRITLRTED